MQWLSTQQTDYVLSGSIEEWRYKAGLDGEPVVALTLSLTAKGQTTPLWTGTIAKVAGDATVLPRRHKMSSPI
ncbi:hypothetical protein P4S68_16985 [Pseudoalteromonas sp. Hal099]